MKLKLFPLLLFFVFGVFSVNTKAVSYGYSLIEVNQYDPAGEITVYAESGTVLDLSTWQYYDPGIQAFLYEDSGLRASTQRVFNYDGPVIYAYTDPEIVANYGRTYTLHGDHYLRTLISYNNGNQWSYQDILGFNYYAGNFPTPYNFSSGSSAWYSYRIYRAATTNVSVSVQRPLQLNSIDRNGGIPGSSFLTVLRGTGLFGTGQGYSQTVQISGSGVTATVRPTSLNTIELIEIQISIDANAQPGIRNLTLTVNGQTSNAINFRVGDNSPILTSVSPSQGNAGDQVSVTLTGSNFGFNPDVIIEGFGVADTVTSSSTGTITAIFSVSQSADPGPRNVLVQSRGVTGNGFESVPGNSSTSNGQSFEVLAASPRVEIPEIGSIEKGSVRTVSVTTPNAPATFWTRLTILNKPDPTGQRPTDGWITGKATFVDQNGNDVTQIDYQGVQPQFPIRIRGLERSTSTNNVKLQARFDGSSNVRKERGFTVSSVEFNVNDQCNGVDVVEFERTLAYNKRYLFVKQSNNNTVKVKVVPSGASGEFRLEPANSDITLSQTIINSTDSQVITVSANATAGQLTAIKVRPNNTDPLTQDSEVLNVVSSELKEVTVQFYGVTEDNDDVPATPPGTGSPNSVAYVFSEGGNGFIDTIAGGDDWLATVPIGQRPPGYSARSRRVFTGNNGILETNPQGDDERFDSKNKEEMALYAPITEIGNGLTDVVCIRSGPNQFLDSTVSRRDYEATDPANPALMIIMSGSDGRCDTELNNEDILPPSNIRNAGDASDFAQQLETYLNNNIWLKQANVHVTVNRTVTPIERNFDLNRDKKMLNPQIGNTTSQVEVDAIINNVSTTTGTYNLYFADVPNSKDDVIGVVYDIPSPHAFYGKQLWQSGAKNEVIAHELGHQFGSPHTAEAVHSEAFKEFYKSDLMYYGQIATLTQCRVRKPQWDRTVNF